MQKAGADVVKIQSFDLNEMTLNINKKDFVIRNKKIFGIEEIYMTYIGRLKLQKNGIKIFDYCKKIKIHVLHPYLTYRH